MNAQAPPPAQASRRDIARGTAWMMLFKLADKCLGLASTLILARLLVPADFGLVALAMAVIAFTQLMGAFGFDSALIQRQDATRVHYDTAWTFNVIVGVSMGCTLAALAVPVARFYDDERLVAILLVLGAGAVVGGFGNIGTVAFRKDLDFRSEFRLMLYKRVATFAVTMLIAFTLRSYWALVLGTLAGGLIGVWISYALHPFRPKLSLAARYDLMHFSKWIFLSNLINFANGRASSFILGSTVGTHGLGTYTIAYEIATMPSTELIAPLNRAVYPAYARLAVAPAKLHERFLEVFGIICLIAIPVSAGLFAIADAAVRVVLGTQWLETIPMIRIFALCGLVGALQSNMYLVIVAMGKPQVSTGLSAWLLVITLPILVWASMQHGVMGASYAMLFHSVAGMTGITVVFRRSTHISGRTLAAAGCRPLTCAALMMVVMFSLDHVLLASWPSLIHVVRLIAMMIVGALSYVSLTWALWRLCGSPGGAEAAIYRLLTMQIVARRRSTSGA